MNSRMWWERRLDQIRVSTAREASSKGDEIIEAMDTFDASHPSLSNWEFSRILVPRLLADLETL